MNSLAFDRCDIAQGLYWYCNDYHGGQGSHLYRILSKVSGIYRPASWEDGPSGGGEMVYAALEAGDLDADELAVSLAVSR
jgi:hypothetical protein